MLAAKSRRLPKKIPKREALGLGTHYLGISGKYFKKVKEAPWPRLLNQLTDVVYDLVRVQGGYIHTVVVAIAHARHIYMGRPGCTYVRI